MDPPDLQSLLEEVFAGHRTPREDDPAWLRALHRRAGEAAEDRRRLLATQRELQSITDRLMRLAAMDFSDLEIPPRTGDDLVDAAHLGLVMMTEELAAAHEALRSARDEAVAANRTKSTFLAHMSHELRTPLNVIIGYCELATEDLEDGSTEQVKDDLGRATSAAHHLLSLISDILDLSKIEAGRVEIVPEEVPLEPLIHQVVDAIRPRAASNGNQLHLDLHPTPPAWADPVRLRQILLNLLDNAVKYTRNGHIDVVSRCDGERIRVDVRDTGSGIPAVHFAKLFQPFHRVDERSVAPGTGLGLAISERLCRQMGGSLEAESVLGAGSTFRVLLQPCPAPEVP